MPGAGNFLCKRKDTNSSTECSSVTTSSVSGMQQDVRYASTVLKHPVTAFSDIYYSIRLVSYGEDHQVSSALIQ